MNNFGCLVNLPDFRLDADVSAEFLLLGYTRACTHLGSTEEPSSLVHRQVPPWSRVLRWANSSTEFQSRRARRGTGIQLHRVGTGSPKQVLQQGQDFTVAGLPGHSNRIWAVQGDYNRYLLLRGSWQTLKTEWSKLDWTSLGRSSAMSHKELPAALMDWWRRKIEFECRPVN